VKIIVSTGMAGSARMAATVASSVSDFIGNEACVIFIRVCVVGDCSDGVVGMFKTRSEMRLRELGVNVREV